MLSFHNDPKVKAKHIKRVEAHRKADNLIKGIGWENGKGCAIGCTLEGYDHSRYPIELGLPEWLARLEDRIFEGLPNSDAQKWPTQFLKAIPVGVDVEPVRHKLAIRRMDRLIALQKKSVGKHMETVDKAIRQTIAALELTKHYHETELGICSIPNVTVRAAYNAACSAADSAADSADSAAYSAAYSAARAAYSAARAADSAADSAARAADSAAYNAACSAADSAADSAARAAWKQEAKDLLELLKECK